MRKKGGKQGKGVGKSKQGCSGAELLLGGREQRDPEAGRIQAAVHRKTNPPEHVSVIT